MPIFLIQKMGSLLKSWNELESSNNFTPPETQTPIPKQRSKNNINQEVNTPPEKPKILPVKIVSTCDTNISSPSLHASSSDENSTPIQEQIIEMTSKTIKKTMITTTETIVTEENIIYDEPESNNQINKNSDSTEHIRIDEKLKSINQDESNNSLIKMSNTFESLISNKSVRLDNADEKAKEFLETESDKRNQFKKTPSIDSIKSKTIVTPIELEPNNMDEFDNISKELNIIKLEADANIIQTTSSSRINLINNDISDMAQSNFLNNNTNSLITSNPKENINIISDDLFDWLLWIDHTLESQIVTVGDHEEMQQAILKYTVINSNILINIF